MIFEIKYCIYCIMCNVESVIQGIVCNVLNSKCVKFFFQNCTQQTDVRCKDIFPECFSPVSSCIQPVHSHHFCIQPVHSHHFCDSDSTYMLLFNSVFWREFKLPIHITFVIVILRFCLKNIFPECFVIVILHTCYCLTVYSEECSSCSFTSLLW